MDIEDVVLVATVREDIRSHKLRINADNIPRHVEAARAVRLASGQGLDNLSTIRRETAEQASWPPDAKQHITRDMK